ncbi:hypothetical protein GCM10009827_025520 [Dactylosporangium maewongense]|uniref:HTH gntR-type domain-containing protein n=1 Tax=Dactylosporangium maewongense TaxID=634393 RepID=A0ABN2A420_9ACTN
MSTTGLPAPARGLGALLDAVSGARMAATVATLAGRPFTGRRVGTAGAAAARAWLDRHLRDLGAAVTVEPFTAPRVPEVYAAPAVEWHDGTAHHQLGFGREVAVHLASADQPLARRGDPAVAGAGDPTGRWLLVPAGMPLSDAYGHAHGALGLLVGRRVDAEGWQYTMLAGPDPGPLPVLTLDTATHAAVRPGGWFATNTPIRRRDAAAANVHARWRTAGPGRPDLPLTAHYDGVGDHPGLWQPGAADNGSGVAVVLETARVLAGAGALPDGAGLSVALLDGEEAGALGSACHAARLRRAGAAPFVVNVDGAGHLDRAAAVEAGGPAHGLLAALDQAGRHTGLPLAAGPVASDNRRYAAAGLAAAGLAAVGPGAVGVGAGMAGYHSPADTADRVETATLTAVARLVVATGWLAGAADTTVPRQALPRLAARRPRRAGPRRRPPDPRRHQGPRRATARRAAHRRALTAPPPRPGAGRGRRTGRRDRLCAPGTGWEVGVAQAAAGIVAELCRRIAAGELRPGETVPSTRGVARELDLPVSAAARALAMMRQDGLVEDAGGAGPVITEQAPGIASGWRPPARRRRSSPAGAEFLALAVRTAIESADADGLAVTSVRRIAVELDTDFATVRKHVGDRAQLEVLMADAIFAGHEPPAPSGDWRAQLEALCRAQLLMYRRHPWLAEAVSFRKPLQSPHVAEHTEWAVRALAGAGAAPDTARRVAVTTASFVRGHAMRLAQEQRHDELQHEEPPHEEPQHRKPRHGEPAADVERGTALFEFGLERLLDGFARLVP